MEELKAHLLPASEDPGRLADMKHVPAVENQPIAGIPSSLIHDNATFPIFTDFSGPELRFLPDAGNPQYNPAITDLMHALQNRNSAALIGVSGCGKTSTIFHLALQHGYDVVYATLSDMDAMIPSDIFTLVHDCCRHYGGTNASLSNTEKAMRFIEQWWVARLAYREILAKAHGVERMTPQQYLLIRLNTRRNDSHAHNINYLHDIIRQTGEGDYEALKAYLSSRNVSPKLFAAYFHVCFAMLGILFVVCPFYYNTSLLASRFVHLEMHVNGISHIFTSHSVCVCV